MDIVERVGLAMCRAADFDETPGLMEAEARVVIAEVFDWLADPGDEQFEEMARCGNQRHIWTSMLTAKRREALGE